MTPHLQFHPGLVRTRATRCIRTGISTFGSRSGVCCNLSLAEGGINILLTIIFARIQPHFMKAAKEDRADVGREYPGQVDGSQPLCRSSERGRASWVP